MSGAWLLVVFGPAVVIALLRNEARRRQVRAATAELRVDATGVHRELADGRREHVDWTDLAVVEVVRARHGPHGPTGGVVLLGADEERGALVPIDRVGEAGVLDYLAGLPGFDLQAFAEAIEERPPTRRLIWERDTPPVGG